MSLTIHLFLNQGFSEVYHSIASIKKGLGDAIRITVSHSDPGSPYRFAADAFIEEPRGLERKAYSEWFHRQTSVLGANMVWPQRRASAILGESFPPTVRAIAAGDAATLDLLGDKVRTYQACVGSEIPVPAYRVVSGATELEAALAEIASSGEAPCIKPAVSTFGNGFRRVVPHSDPFQRLLQNDTLHVSRDQLLELCAGSVKQVPLLVMPYLEGPEYSIDCLASRGRLERHVARRKLLGSRGQLLTTSAEIERITAAATALFNLDAVYNVQLREHRGQLFLLEINARMSGGLGMACASGLNFPEWAVRLAAGADPAEVPMPRYGSVVTQIDTPVVLSTGSVLD